jgi:general secretion pathway protein L
MNALLADLSGTLKRGTHWWTGELASLVPSVLNPQPGNRELDAIVAIGADGAARLITEGTGARTSKFANKDVWDNLGQLGRGRTRARVGLRLPFSACYRRRVEIPAGARNQASAILALDLERATPFKSSDVYTAHYLERTPGKKGWLDAFQLVTKRSFADKWIGDIEALGPKVVHVDCWGDDEETPIAIDFLSASTAEPRRRSATLRWRLLFLALAGSLALSAVSLAIWRHETALRSLEEKVTAARTIAKASRQKRDELEAAGAQTAALQNFRAARPATVDTIEELTRLLPDSASLTDLKIDGDAVDLSGFAKSAASIIPILERSNMFKDAVLTAPVTFDTAESKERFSLKLKFRKSQQAGAAKPAEAAP